MSFDWNLMPAFLAAFERGSLMGAARVLKTSQPTVGRHIALLEAQLGVALFERTGRGLLPTEAAQAIAAQAEGMRANADALLLAARGEGGPPGGTVRISASQPIAGHLLLPLLAELREIAPAIQIELVATNGVSNLLRREADIALRMLRPTQGSLVTRRIANVPIGAYASHAYLDRQGSPLTPADLLRHALVGYDSDEALLRGLNASGVAVQREHFAFRCDDMLIHWQAVCAGLGIGFIGCYAGDAEPRVRRVLPDLPIAPLPLWLTVHREIRGSARIRVVYDFLARALARELKADQAVSSNSA